MHFQLLALLADQGDVAEVLVLLEVPEGRGEAGGEPLPGEVVRGYLHHDRQMCTEVMRLHYIL